MSDPLEELERLAPGMSDAAAGVRLGEKAERLLTRFAEASRQQRRLAALVALAMLLDARRDSQAKTLADKALAAAQEAGEAMAEVKDGSSLDIALECYSDYVQALGALESTLRPLWRSLAEQQFGPLASAGALLKDFSGARDLAGRMQTAAQEAIASTQTAKPLDDLLALIRRLLPLRQDLLQEQQSVAGEPEVAAFLQALADQRATLDLLTPAVLKWLGDQNALAALQVVAQ